MLTRPVRILLIEDSPSDQLLAREAFADAAMLSELDVVADGVEAMAYLNAQGRYGKALRPDLILLDLNLPRKDGCEVLAEIKGSSHLKQIPVVVLTTSESSVDVSRAYDLHANCYVSKPVDFDEFKVAIQAIEDFWFRVVRLPSA